MIVTDWTRENLNDCEGRAKNLEIGSNRILARWHILEGGKLAADEFHVETDSAINANI